MGWWATRRVAWTGPQKAILQACCACALRHVTPPIKHVHPQVDQECLEELCEWLGDHLQLWHKLPKWEPSHLY